MSLIVRTRVAPSPTGYSHLAFVKVALSCYALAKKNNGQFIWRNEDTDRVRFVPDALKFNMKWVREFGLDWDEGPDIGGIHAPYNQSERIPLYKVAYEKLISNNYAYRCFCTRERLEELREYQQISRLQTKYDGKCRNLSSEEIDIKLKNNEPFTIRIKVPKNKKIEFNDSITQNHIVWDSNEIDDYIIVKSNGIPTYHLASVYDDIAMKITHVLRGSEWISTTPVHLLVYEGLGVMKDEIPAIGHFTVILDPNNPGKKMSKRNSSFRINGLLQKGYMKEAILNYLMLLGWAPKDNQELFTLNEFINSFDLSGMQKANPTWDQKKMDWFNGLYIRKLNLEELVNEFLSWINKYLLTTKEDELNENFILNDFNTHLLNESLNLAKLIIKSDRKILKSYLILVQQRATNFWEMLNQLKFFYYRPENINWEIKQLKNLTNNINEIKKELYNLMDSLEENSSNWKHEKWEEKIREIGDKYKFKHGDIFMVLRVAIVGVAFSPPLFESLQLISRDEVLKRLS